MSTINLKLILFNKDTNKNENDIFGITVKNHNSRFTPYLFK